MTPYEPGTPLEALQDAMRHGHAVRVTTGDGTGRLGRVLHMTDAKAWMVVGDHDEFIPLDAIECVETYNPLKGML